MALAPCSTMDVLFSCCLWSNAGGVSAMKGRRFKQGVRSFMVDVLASVQKTLRIVFWEGNAILHQLSPSIFVDILIIYLSIYRSIDLSINICMYTYIYIHIDRYSFIYLQLYIHIYIYYLVVSSIFNYIPFFQGFSNPGESKPLLAHPKTPSTWILVQRRLPWKISNGPCTPMH